MQNPAPLEAVESLVRYAYNYGEEWRRKLSNAWLCGSTDLDTYPGLYKLRNTHGPEWLVDVELEKLQDAMGAKVSNESPVDLRARVMRLEDKCAGHGRECTELRRHRAEADARCADAEARLAELREHGPDNRH